VPNPDWHSPVNSDTKPYQWPIHPLCSHHGWRTPTPPARPALPRPVRARDKYSEYDLHEGHVASTASPIYVAVTSVARRLRPQTGRLATTVATRTCVSRCVDAALNIRGVDLVELHV